MASITTDVQSIRFRVYKKAGPSSRSLTLLEVFLVFSCWRRSSRESLSDPRDVQLGREVGAWQHTWSELTRALHEDGVRLIVCDSGYLAGKSDCCRCLGVITAGLRNANREVQSECEIHHSYIRVIGRYILGIPLPQKSSFFMSRKFEKVAKRSHVNICQDEPSCTWRSTTQKSIDKKIECFVQVLCTTPQYP
jgi:hypothetical protein